MSVLTYKDLYSQVLELINESMLYPTSDVYGDGQTSRSQVISSSPFTVAGVGSDLSEVTNTLLNLVGSIVPNRIKSGLIVSETDPISSKVKITTGEGIANARIYSLNKDVEIQIPFDSTTSVFYINLFINGVEVATTTSADRLNLAKIIIPNPGVTTKIQDNRDSVTQVNGYIVSLREITLFGNDKGIFDEDSVDVIKDNFREIAAETIIGTLTLDESLKISNVAGSLKLDSNSMKILDSSKNLLAKFNRNGTFFYDSNEREVARFTSSDAKIGNILITKNSVQSDDFASGALGSGFRIQDSGNAEFNNVYVRGKISSSIFEKESVSIVGGNLLVMDGDILNSDMSALDSSTMTISGDTTFSVGDKLRCKDGTNDEWFSVTNVASAPTYTVTRDMAGSYAANTNPIWKKGTAIVNYGASGEGGIYMTSSEATSPYLSVVTHAGSPWSALTTHLRLGNLNGFLGYSSDKYGIAIGESDKYLKYDPTNGLRIKGVITCEAGSTGYTNTFAQDAIPTSTNIGDLWLDTNDNNKLYRAASIGADQVTAGEWEEYRDDTIATAQGTADTAISNAATAQSAAEGAQSDATTGITNAATAQALLDDISADTKITPVEKLTIKPIWDDIVVEGTATTGTIPVQATAFGVSDVDFDTAYAALNVLLNTTYTVFGNMTTTTTIVRATWDAAWEAYYTERTNLLNDIAAAAKTLADNAQSTADSKTDDTVANTKAKVFRQSAVPTAVSVGDLWIDTDDNKLYRATNVGDDQIIAGEWELQNAAIATGWSHSSDVTKIDGGDVYAGSSIVIGTGAGAGLLRIGQTAYDTGTGFWVGDDSGTYKLSIGNSAGNKLIWNGSALSITGSISSTSTVGGLLASTINGWKHTSDVTKIDGGDIYTDTVTATQINVTNLAAINADLGSITAGTVTGATIQTAASGSRTVLTPTALTCYDDSSNEIFKVLLNGADVGDVIIGDYANNKGVKWDQSEATFDIRGSLDAGDIQTGLLSEIPIVIENRVNDTGCTQSGRLWFRTDV